ncbi:hypothetical protein [Sphingosinicella rhizophila]|uniref:Uncharacterized protein n=1 Tax=Sphingosinicella rhizophila TaxID=3050082 RepID=A0ABU3QBY7_9SPHN|nr:hypothetical protein [Sphingosinicella sp. GR2756]MDT9600852.1 hypothetical protein [Sphingosinicella sp. GR2756]
MAKRTKRAQILGASKAIERARAFTAEWFAQCAQMENLTAEYDTLKSVQSRDGIAAAHEGPNN